MPGYLINELSHVVSLRVAIKKVVCREVQGYEIQTFLFMELCHLKTSVINDHVFGNIFSKLYSYQYVFKDITVSVN